MEEKENKIKKAWKWIWKSDSILSWVIALVIAFIIIKFIFFPLLSLALGTSLPLVVVESGSMHHPGSFLGNTFSTQASFTEWWTLGGNWYQNIGIEKDEASKWPLRTGLEKGDIIVVYGRGSLKKGDIIIFNANQKYPIIHRIISISDINGQNVYSTKGDNYITNYAQLPIEKQIPEDAIIGKAVFRIPKLGWLKLAFSGFGN